MKKIILLLCLGLFIFSSCKKEYIPVNNNQTILFDVPSSNWGTSDGGVTYDISLAVPEITSYFNSTGQVSVYISYGNGVYEQIPEVYNDVSLSFTHNTGDVSVYAQDLTHVVMAPPASATIKVILTGSSQ